MPSFDVYASYDAVIFVVGFVCFRHVREVSVINETLSFINLTSHKILIHHNL